MKKVLYIQALHPSGMELLKKKYDVIVADNENKEYIKSIIGDFNAVVTRLTRIDKDIIESGKKLEAIAKHGVGTDNIDVNFAKAKGIEIITTGDANSNSVAEHTVFALGALSKRIPYLDVSVRKGHWAARDETGSVDFSEKTVGIVGLGRIGERVAKIVKNGFNAKVYVYDPFMTKEEIEKKEYLYVDTVEQLCEISDYITIHTPLTEGTRNLIDYKKLKLMKPTAYLANFARGGIVNEKDLFRALKEKVIAGAAIDAFEKEPPETESELMMLDNVLLSPHCGTFSEDSKKRMSLAVAYGIDKALSK